METRYVYRFQLIDTKEMCEIPAGDSAEAFRKCCLERKWPVDRITYLGKREADMDKVPF